MDACALLPKRVSDPRIETPGGDPDIYRLIKTKSWIYREPSNTAAVDTQCLFGHEFCVYSKHGAWAYGQAVSPVAGGSPGYTGWMRLSHLRPSIAAPTHRIVSLKAPLFSRRDIKSRIKKILPLNALIGGALEGGERGLDAEDTDFIRHGRFFIHRAHAAPIAAPRAGGFPMDDFIAAAEAHMGLPYIWGGVSTDGLDCSGLIQSSLRAVGHDCLRDADQQEASLGKTAAIGGGLTRGDLIFWPGHVGLMADEATLLHANAFHMRTAKEPLRTAAARIGAPRTIKRMVQTYCVNVS